MKPIAAVIIAAGLSVSQTLLAQNETKEAQRKVYKDNISSVVGVTSVLKIEVSMNGQPGGSQEQRLVSNGVVVADGLVALAYRTIRPDVANKGAKRPGLKIESKISEIKLLDANGEEYDAKLVLHDQTLGLAFLALDPKSEKSKKFKFKAVDISKDVKLKYLDDVIQVGRLSEKMRSVGRVTISQVNAIITRPRTLYILQPAVLSNPTFNEAGDFVGIVVAVKSAGNLPVLMPAKYLRKLLVQAKKKQAELANAESSEKE